MGRSTIRAAATATAKRAASFTSQSRPSGNRWSPRKRNGPSCSPANAVTPQSTPDHSVANGQRVTGCRSTSSPSNSAKTAMPAANPRVCRPVSQKSRDQAPRGRRLRKAGGRGGRNRRRSGRVKRRAEPAKDAGTNRRARPPAASAGTNGSDRPTTWAASRLVTPIAKEATIHAGRRPARASRICVMTLRPKAENSSPQAQAAQPGGQHPSDRPGQTRPVVKHLSRGGQGRQGGHLRDDQNEAGQALRQPQAKPPSRQRVEKRLRPDFAFHDKEHGAADQAVSPRHRTRKYTQGVAGFGVLRQPAGERQERDAEKRGRADGGQADPGRQLFPTFFPQNRDNHGWTPSSPGARAADSGEAARPLADAAGGAAV